MRQVRHVGTSITTKYGTEPIITSLYEITVTSGEPQPDFEPYMASETARIAAVKKAQTYEYCYWRYVGSVTTDDAKYWFNQMIAQVSLDLQPRADGKSWQEDRESSRTASSWPWRKNLPGIVFMLAMIVLPVLFGLGVIH